MQMRVYPGSRRYSEVEADRVVHHSFSFGEHYDPDNLAFGPMRAFDDHRLSWGAGYDDHPHSEVELVTWVLHGQLVHTDAYGHRSPLPAGTVAVQSAGSGIRHGEHADTSPEPTRFLQSWLVPDEAGIPPARFVASGMESTTLAPIAGEGAQVPVGTAGATLWAGDLPAGSTHDVPVCASHHLFVATGSAVLKAPGEPDIELDAGDAVRITGADDVEMTLTATGADGTPTQVALWTFRTPA